jgi:hypothetical protein
MSMKGTADEAADHEHEMHDDAKTHANEKKAPAREAARTAVIDAVDTEEEKAQSAKEQARM